MNEATETVEYGNRVWRLPNGLTHRDNDLPAIIYANGDQYWCQNGKLHRDNDMPAVINANGLQYWYQNDKRHRDDGPAVIGVGGLKQWFIKGSFIKETREN
jgi:hypothetical protein